MSETGLTREFLQERDTRIFSMRKAGVPTPEIAKRFQISISAVNNAISRQLQKLNREALLAYPEMLRLELERLDTLQQALWPLTQHRRVTADDGTEIAVEPDMKAVQQVLAIMDRRSKLLGMEAVNVNLNVEASEPARAVLAGAAGAAAADKFDPETEARQLLELMGRSGVLPAATVDSLLDDPLEIEASEVTPQLTEGTHHD